MCGYEMSALKRLRMKFYSQVLPNNVNEQRTQKFIKLMKKLRTISEEGEAFLRHIRNPNRHRHKNKN